MLKGGSGVRRIACILVTRAWPLSIKPADQSSICWKLSQYPHKAPAAKLRGSVSSAVQEDRSSRPASSVESLVFATDLMRSFATFGACVATLSNPSILRGHIQISLQRSHLGLRYDSRPPSWWDVTESQCKHLIWDDYLIRCWRSPRPHPLENLWLFFGQCYVSGACASSERSFNISSPFVNFPWILIGDKA